jgi:enterochelin esterase-like enzyme
MPHRTPARSLSLVAAACLAATTASAALAPPPTAAPPASAQPAAPAPGPRPQTPAVVSPDVQADRRVTFRIHAPQAESVRLTGSDIPGNNQGAAMTKGENGVWEVTLGPIDPGAYRYTFNIAGVPVIDPRNPSTSESNTNTWSLVYVPGSDFSDTKDVPRGAIAELTYYSTTLGRFRRLHVYTPPGYEDGTQKYPVFYLLHGAGDGDDSWSSVGRAGFILDNLIAARKAKPMVVVMPAGHTRAVGGGMPANDEFNKDFLTDIVPTVEKRYRIVGDRAHRAIAGLSMGGSQTLNIAIPNLEKFAYVGVFSSGLIGAFGPVRPGAGAPPPPPPGTPNPWEQQNLAALDNAAAKKGLKLLWFATGKDDFLVQTTRNSVDLLKKHGFAVVYEETEGAHTWIKWRDYLRDFTPQLFQ